MEETEINIEGIAPPNLSDPIYDITKTYAENLQEGPFFSGKIPARARRSVGFQKHLFSFPVESTIGIPAGPLLNSLWVSFAARCGFDILTYKTIRSRAHPAHPLPNVIPVEMNGMIIPKDLNTEILAAQRFPTTMEGLAITNSFGMPSMNSSYLAEDIEQAQASLAEGQLLIVSVVGTQSSKMSLFDDFVDVASMAKDFGAKVIEANFSCPNVQSQDGSLYQNPAAVSELTAKIKKAIGSTPLILKLGVMENLTLLREVLRAAHQGGAVGVCGLNTLSMKVTNHHGKAALSPDRLTSGICGAPIRQLALNFVSDARQIIDTEGLDLTLIGVGGITKEEHFKSFYEHGADAAFSATGMMWDPFLALRYHRLMINPNQL